MQFMVSDTTGTQKMLERIREVQCSVKTSKGGVPERNFEG